MDYMKCLVMLNITDIEDNNQLHLKKQLNKKNRIVLEINKPFYIRIVEIQVSGYVFFKLMMLYAKMEAKENDCKVIFFADKLPNNILKMYKKYGFVEKEVSGDPYNHYLYFFLNKGGCG